MTQNLHVGDKRAIADTTLAFVFVKRRIEVDLSTTALQHSYIYWL